MKIKFKELMVTVEDFFYVETKSSEVIPFILNVIQREFVNRVLKFMKDNPEKPLRLIILKGRQFGFSTMILAWFFIKCMLVNNTRAAVVSHDQEATKKLFRRVKFFAKTLCLPPTLDKESEREFGFPKTNSYFYIGTAGSKAFGRGDNLTDVHCSEVAFWDNAATVMNGLAQAVGKTGNIIIETTANGIGNYFQKLWIKSYRKKDVAWLALFFKWTDFDEYEMEPAKGFVRTVEEERICKKHPEMTDRKLAWRRWKISETEADKGKTPEQIFMQEYPLTPREAFISSGDSVFSLEALEMYEPKKEIDIEDGLIIWKKPTMMMTYMGIDVAEGLENQDRSVIDIYDHNLEQVAHWAGWCDPDELGKKAAILARRYKSYVVPELNNMGHLTVDYLKKNYNTGMIYKREVLDAVHKTKVKKIAWRTTTPSKGRMIGALAEMIREHGIKFNCIDTIEECMSFIKNGKGGMEAESGANDDRVIAAGLAVQGYLDRPPRIKVVTKEEAQEMESEKINKKWRAERKANAKKRAIRRAKSIKHSR